MSGTGAAAPKWRDLGARTASALVLMPLVLLDVWLGGAWFTLFVGLLGVMLAHEWTLIVHGQSSSQFALHAASALSGTFLPLDLGVGPALAALAALSLGSAALARTADRSGGPWPYLGVAYVGLPCLALMVLRVDAGQALFWLFAVVWAADIAAYFCGRLLGGPKLAPAISPAKTWAGLGGAMAGGGLAGVAAAAALGLGLSAPLAWLGAVLGLVEQAGDLFESALKRHYGIKDSGALIPGHGGVLDRVDGLIAAAVAAMLVGLMRGGPGAAGQGLLVW